MPPKPLKETDALDSLKSELQRFFADGLALIIGSGLSMAEGIPGMGVLEKHLGDNVPKRVTNSDLALWEKIAAELAAGKGLETALHTVTPTEKLESAIIDLTAQLIEPAEQKVIEAVISGKRVLPLSRLLPLANPQPNRPLPVITTNYERLSELAAEAIGWGVDTMFTGQAFGSFDPEASKMSFVKRIVNAKPARMLLRPHIALSKPHGSLDWFQGPRGPLRTSIPLDLPRLIITPGSNKYVKGYDQPFDRHREAGNRAIDQAARLLVLGYGFNDRHLETHLNPVLNQGKPCLVLTRALTANARALVARNAGMIALSAVDGKPDTGFVCTRKGLETNHDGFPLWQLEYFVTQVLNP